MIVDYMALRRALIQGSPGTRPAPADYELDSVCLLLFDRAETILLAIQKTDSAGYHWRDQVALPGGRIEAGDADATGAALRELREELGIEPLSVQVLGGLGHFQTATSKNDLTVVVGRWTAPGELRADAREVARVLEIRLADLIDLHHSQRLPGKEQLSRTHDPVYALPDVRIWGVTARILQYFLDLLTSEPGILHRTSSGQDSQDSQD